MLNGIKKSKFIWTYLNSFSISFIFIPFLSRGRGDSKALGNGALYAGAGLTGSSLSLGFFFLVWLVLVALVVGLFQVDLRFFCF